MKVYLTVLWCYITLLVSCCESILISLPTEFEINEFGLLASIENRIFFICGLNSQTKCNDTLEVEVPLQPYNTTLYWYKVDVGNLKISKIDAVQLPSADRSYPTVQSPSGSSPIVGVLYEGWHVYATNASNIVESITGSPALTVEDVIRSNGTLSLSDIWDKYNITSDQTQSFFWHTTPVLGKYCLYRKRWNESVGILPDCANIQETVLQHALWFNNAGVDFLTADGTNLCTPSDFADAIQTRPMEVLFEEFSRLRGQGIRTPAIAAWQRLVSGCTLHSQILDIYNNATFDSIVYRDPASGKKVFFVPDSPDQSLIEIVESNGGRNDILVQEMWALFANGTYDSGRWAFESPCTFGADFTNSVVGRGKGATGCGQFETEGSALGSAIAVSPSYQTSYGSLPFQGANKYEGLTYKRQFGTIFDNAVNRLRLPDNSESSVLPANIYLSSFNEWLAQPQPNPWSNAPFSFSMGLEFDTIGKKNLWVDTFGVSISRDIEPTTDGGFVYLDIMTSCLRVINILSHLVNDKSIDNASLAAMISGRESLSACSVEGEICCSYNETTDGFELVTPLVRLDGGDSMLSIDSNEVKSLTCQGCGWSETCNPYNGGDGTPDFCQYDPGSALLKHSAVEGPFVVRSSGCGVRNGDPILPERIPLLRCIDSSTKTHTLVAGSGVLCPTSFAVEVGIGCLIAVRTSNTPRSFRLCTAASTGKVYHSLDSACIAGDISSDILGYVH
jgi:hypothetical protein